MPLAEIAGPGRAAARRRALKPATVNHKPGLWSSIPPKINGRKSFPAIGYPFRATRALALSHPGIHPETIRAFIPIHTGIHPEAIRAFILSWSKDE